MARERKKVADLHSRPGAGHSQLVIGYSDYQAAVVRLAGQGMGV